ncbi:MAG: phosphatase PAP2 family protein [Acidobacteria bacterium]|nr:phosphatase PAP2 family protein [Acidobacteriota bacterium]
MIEAGEAVPQARLLLPRPLVIAVALAALLVCWAAAVHLREVSSIPGSRFDAAWAVRIDAHHTHFRDVVAATIAVVGGVPGGVLVDLGVAALILLLRGWAASLTMVAALGLNEVDVLALKWVSERHPPGASGLYLGFLGSFPSGHTANAAVIVVSIGILARRLLVWAGGAAYVAVMGIDRTYLDAHWVTDTIAGAVAGAAVAALVWSAARPAQRRRLTSRAGTVPVPHGGARGRDLAMTSPATWEASSPSRDSPDGSAR